MACVPAPRYHGAMSFDAPFLLMGARDYAHACWRTQLYPPDLPPEWRFIFYSHRYPAILMPARAWGFAPERLSLWESEAPPSFRMVLEVSDRALERFLALGVWPQPLIAGCVVRVTRQIGSLMPRLKALARVLPVAVDVRGAAEGLAATLSGIGVGLCGRPADGRIPSGPFAVSLIEAGDRALLGQALTALLAAPASQGRALFFSEPKSAIRSLEEAQWLASLLGESH